MAAQLVLGGFPDELAADNAPVALEPPLVGDSGSRSSANTGAARGR